MNINEKVAEVFDNIKDRPYSESDVEEVVQNANDILSKVTGALTRFKEDISGMISLVKDYKNGSYREVPTKTIVAVVGALLYVLAPINLIPDFIPVVGQLDDAAVVGLCLKLVDADIQKYLAWKKSQQTNVNEADLD